MIRTFCLFALALVAFAADDLPKAASDAVEKSRAANAKTFITWKQAVEKDRAALTKTLEGILASESKKKNNDAAVAALKAKLDELKNDDWVATAIKEQSADADDLLGEMMTEKEVLAAISGVWYIVGDLPGSDPLLGKIVYDIKAMTITTYKYDKLTKALNVKPDDVHPFKITKVNGKWSFISMWGTAVEYKPGNISVVGTNSHMAREK